MFRIRRILDCTAAGNRAAVAQVQAILRAQFGTIREKEIDSLPEKLNDPLKYRFQSRLLVAENKNDTILGFALMLYAPDIGFCYLDYIAAGKNITGQGLGGALYERVRDEARSLGSICLLMECLPDDPALSPNPVIRKQNAKRLAFYERYGAFPIAGTRYETPVKEGDTDPPYLVMDTLGRALPDGKIMRKAVRAILERKYEDLCSPAYIDGVVKSFPRDEISLRKARYNKKDILPQASMADRKDRFVLVANEGHAIHHVRERGYVESPVRLRIILRALEKLPFFEKKPAEPYSDKHILAVHDADYVSFLKKACLNVPMNKSVYPYVFPIRNQERKPTDTPLLAGYYCIDTFTPLNINAYRAARAGVDCALTAAHAVAAGARAAYALVRPPGHHAERKSFGGFCYFSNTAMAANLLSAYGKVAILDIDYHHGNGQQDIFYRHADVLTISIHGHPKFAYPYFTGFADESGEGEGRGYNINMPLPEKITVEDYFKQLKKAIKKINEYSPAFLVLALGLDTAKDDPTGSWPLESKDFMAIGHEIGAMGLPTVIVQEGGYRTQTLGKNARHFFTGLHKAVLETPLKNPKKKKTEPDKRTLRRTVRLSDIEAVRKLVHKAGVFSQEEIDCAAELVAEAAHNGEEKSGYSFIFLEEAGKLLGYACYGRVLLTASGFDLYWIVVDQEWRGKGVAQELMTFTEQAIRAQKGTHIYAETSSLAGYAPARAFYEKAGFEKTVTQKDFYKAGDDRVTYTKNL